MRLDARNGDYGWQVYHAEACAMLRFVVWVDDVTNEYYQLPGPLLFGSLHRARKIDILPSPKLVIINPVEDHERVEAIATIPLWLKENA